METTQSHHHPPRAARWGPWRLAPPPITAVRKLKILLLHGFCSSPRELRPLGRLLAKSGFHCMAPLLPGHGEQFAGMNSCLVEDWLEAVRLTYEALRRDGSPVAVVGYCLGGTLALLLGPELGPRGLVVLAAPISGLRTEKFQPHQGDTNYELLETRKWTEDSSSDKARRWRLEGCHSLVTQNFLHTFETSVQRAHSQIPLIRCPILVGFGAKDEAVPVSEADSLLESLSPDCVKERIIAKRAGHALLLDFGRNQIRNRILNFLDQLDQAEAQLSF